MSYLCASDVEGSRISGVYGQRLMSDAGADEILPDFEDWEVVVMMGNQRAFSLRKLCFETLDNPIEHAIRVEEWSGNLGNFQRLSNDEIDKICGLQIIKIVSSRLLAFKIGVLLESKMVLTFGVSECEMTYTTADFSKIEHFRALQSVHILG